MKPEDTSGSQNENKNDTGLPPELEARVVAWVLGEASPFEIAELERLCAEKPELAVFKRRIEAVHGLVGEAERPVEASLRLSEERRASLLKTLGAPAAASTQHTLTALPAPRRKKFPGWAKWSGGLSAAAAAVIVIGFTLSEPFKKTPRPDPSLTTLGRASEEPKAQELAMLQVASDDARKKAEMDSVREIAFRRALTEKREDTVPQLAQTPTRPMAPAAARQSEGRVESDVPRQTDLPQITFSPSAVSGSAPAPAPASAPISLGNQFSSEKQTAPTPSEIVKMDAFVVSEERQGSAMAISNQAARANIAVPNIPLPLQQQVRDEAGGNLGAISGTGSAAQFGGNSNPARSDKDTAAYFYSRNSTSSTPLSTGGGTITIVGGSLSSPGAIIGQVPVDRSSVDAVGAAAPTTATWGSLGTNGGAGGLIRGGTERLADNTAAAAPAASSPKETEVVTLQAFTVSTDSDRARRGVASARGSVFPDPAAKKKTSEPDVAPVRAPRAIEEALRNEIPTATQSVSTFSLHVSDVSYRLARAALERGQRPDAGAIRPEEFYNAFDYGDPAPVAGEPVAARIEQAAHPFLLQRNFVRVALKVPASGRGAAQPLELTVLLDTSGSMERDDRVAAVRRAFDVLASLLGPNDRVTLFGFARTPRLLADRLPGNAAKQLNDIVRRTPAEGGTNLEEALKLAGDHARVNYVTGAQNRIVLLTDGAANLGNADPAQLATMVAALRQQGIAFDACGVGLGDGFDDTVLEALTRKGDGRYYAINSPEDADAKFARQLAGAFRPAARDVKVQVRFNPARVRSYRLIGFEQHRLREEDFRNDKIDAAELAAEEAAVALYQVEVIADGEGELGEAFVRFRRADNSETIERKWTLPFVAQPAAFHRASPSLQLAGSAALLAEKLRGGPAAGVIRLAELSPVVNSLRAPYARDARVRDFITTFGQARRILGE